MGLGKCRSCGANTLITLIDFGDMPLANSYPASEDACQREMLMPLHAVFCETCWLVQLLDSVSPELLFDQYSYLSSYSTTWLEHAERFVDKAISKWNLTKDSLVLEIASNDGYLLKNFLARKIPVLGVEPAENIALQAISQEIPTLQTYFNLDLSQKLKKDGINPDLVIANNVMAHVPSLNDFVAGVANLLSPSSIFSIEFPSVQTLLTEGQFDQIYHEHYSYFSLHSCSDVLERHGLRVIDVETLPTHGGSLRVTAALGDAKNNVSGSVAELMEKEVQSGLCDLSIYQRFGKLASDRTSSVMRLLKSLVDNGKVIAAYGAAAKGNTLLNYCHIDRSIIDFVVDKSPLKHNHFLPGSHIPIYDVDILETKTPDFLVLLPYNLENEIIAQLKSSGLFSGQFIGTLPQAHII